MALPCRPTEPKTLQYVHRRKSCNVGLQHRWFLRLQQGPAQRRTHDGGRRASGLVRAALPAYQTLENAPGQTGWHSGGTGSMAEDHQRTQASADDLIAQFKAVIQEQRKKQENLRYVHQFLTSSQFIDLRDADLVVSDEPEAIGDRKTDLDYRIKVLGALLTMLKEERDALDRTKSVNAEPEDPAPEPTTEPAQEPALNVDAVAASEAQAGAPDQTAPPAA